MDDLSEMMDELKKNVCETTRSVNNIQLYTKQLRNALRRTEKPQTRETNIAAKQTAENILKLIVNNAKETSNNEYLNSTSFLDCKSNAEERISMAEDALTVVRCVIESTNHK